MLVNFIADIEIGLSEWKVKQRVDLVVYLVDLRKEHVHLLRHFLFIFVGRLSQLNERVIEDVDIEAKGFQELVLLQYLLGPLWILALHLLDFVAEDLEAARRGVILVVLLAIVILADFEVLSNYCLELLGDLHSQLPQV